MGFIEETGAAQHLRDARITTIYEGIHRHSGEHLSARKMGREEGRTALALIAEMEKLLPTLSASSDASLKSIATRCRGRGQAALKPCSGVETFPSNPAAVAAARSTC